MITINLKNRCSSKKSLALFMQTNITHLKELEQTRTGETYATAFNSFMRFTNGEDVSLSEMDSDMMVAYETYLKVNGVSMNTISFYMRILRAVYNRAVEQGITLQRYQARSSPQCDKADKIVGIASKFYLGLCA